VAESVFHLSFSYRFEAAHRFTLSCEDSCATPHGHTWRAKAVFKADGANLAGDDMVMEFSKLKSSWKRFIQDRADHSFFHHYKDPILPALKEFIPKFRGLPFPGDPTTELIAALFYAKLCVMHETVKAEAGAPVPHPAAVVIRETPTNTVTFRAGAHQALLEAINAKYAGWWQTADVGASNCERRG
jgi:6-pyruvoyltetrahydropterin/6-carboxytetrahydropterin synthase